MNSITIRILIGMATVASVAFGQQDDAIRGCRAFAALATSAYYDDIFVTVGRVFNNRNGNFALSWEAWVSDERAITGTCESDVRGTVVKFERVAERMGRKPAISAQGGFGQGGFNNNPNVQQGGFNQGQQQGGFNQGQGRVNQVGGGFGAPVPAVANAGAATADNAGKGTFNGFGANNIPLDHAHVVMQNGRGVVTISGPSGRVTLQGQVTRQISDREFEITIDGTDRGRNASGTVLLRMTPAHNEAEEIVINGQNGNQPFNGRFTQ